MSQSYKNPKYFQIFFFLKNIGTVPGEISKKKKKNKATPCRLLIGALEEKKTFVSPDDFQGEISKRISGRFSREGSWRFIRRNYQR